MLLQKLLSLRALLQQNLSFSNKAPLPPPPSPLFSTPWREESWGNNQRALQYVSSFLPQNDEVRYIRVLLYGPVGAGKSSFVNSVSNVLRRRVTCAALASATISDRSFTKKYLTHRIQRDGRGNFYPFVFNDTMGLEEGPGRGIHTHDIKLAMMGHIKEGYKFNPLFPMSDSDPGYNSSPSLGDRVHVLVCVYSANSAQLRSSILQKLVDIREAASGLGVPQLVVLTNIDEACPDTKINLRNVYSSKHLRKRIGDFSSSLGIPINCILPVKNYSHEIQTCSDVDTLILRAVRLMIDFGDDYADNVLT